MFTKLSLLITVFVMLPHCRNILKVFRLLLVEEQESLFVFFEYLTWSKISDYKDTNYS